MQKIFKILKNFIKSNTTQVLLAGICSFLILLGMYYLIDISEISNAVGETSESKIIMLLKNNGIWTLITAIISSPIFFVIWRLRDQNATQQINNQRKDINLKEFQKIAEWVSGSHLIEDEITEKTKIDNEGTNSLIEKTTKYTTPAESQSIPTFSKKDGAVGLQIAAIHNLLPFFQGKHGDDFRRPALNLLTSAWLSLQQPLLKLDILKDEDGFDEQIKKIQKQATSPIGIAITQVLLSDGGDNLLRFPEVFPNLCLAGMDFHLPGLDKKVLTLFQRANLQGTQLQIADLQGADLQRANLQGTNLQKAKLQFAYLQNTNLQKSSLQWANLTKANLENASLQGTGLQVAVLQGANLQETDLQRADLQETNLQGADLLRAKLQLADLHQTNLLGAITHFSNNNEIITSLKSQGCVILHFQAHSFSYSTLHLTRNNQKITHTTYEEIDLEKTRQENPDWEITIEEIEEF